MPYFRKKPVVIEAREYTGELYVLHELMDWIGPTAYHNHNHLYFSTLEGTMEALPGDWIIKGVNEEFYPIKPDIFEKTYGAIA